MTFSLSSGDWIALVGLISGWGILLLGTIVRINTRFVRVESTVKEHDRRIGYLEAPHRRRVQETPV